MNSLVGGPLDGAYAVAPGRPWVFLQRMARRNGLARARVVESQNIDAVLYRRDGDELVFAGYTHAVCECGGMNELFDDTKRIERCRLCGSSLG